MKITKHPGGRPTKYYPEITAKIEEYMSMCGRENMALPTVEGLAIHLDVNSDTIRQWGKKHKKFSATIKRLADKQKEQLMNDGMYGGKEINQAMAIFLLKVNHQMKEPPTVQVNTQVNVGKVYVKLPSRKKVKEVEVIEEVK